MNTPIRHLFGALCAASLFAATAAEEPAAASAASSQTGQMAQRKSAVITVTVDPRIELLAVAQHLSGYARRHPGRINDLEHPYLAEIRQHFAPFKGHEAIKRLASLGLGGSVPVDIAVHMSAPNEVALQGPLPWNEALAERAHAYVAALRTFAQETNFMAFFEAHRASHEAIVADFRNTIDLQAIASELERYCGTEPDRYTIVLAPLLGRTWFGPSATAADGTKISYAVIPPHAVEEGHLVFGSRSLLDDYVCHEFGHSFLNPLVDKHWNELAGYSKLMERVHYAEGQNYGREWKTCLYEHLDRAVTARVILRRKGEGAYTRQLESDKARGFLFVEELCRALENYEGNRDRFPNLDSFFPELARVFAQLQNTTPEPAARG